MLARGALRRVGVRSGRESFPRKIGVGKKEERPGVFSSGEGSSALSVVRSWAERRGARRRV